ncbi:MAG: flagellar hook-associated protein FlgK [Clostridiales bacterium]|jgi:flagellar hook-associated protein 1 FlgK|nr:flagellar hook-associated protein FlgK [Clostridiales bacterium]
MASTFGSLEIAKTGLSVAMTNLKLTGHNIANANTVGYTRQRLITSAIEPTEGRYLLSQVTADKTGRGVAIVDTQQVRNLYLDNQYRDLNMDYNYSEYRTNALAYLEGLFNSELKEGQGITGSLESFYQSLKDFANNTTSEEYRTSVQQAAVSMTENFRVLYDEMIDLWDDQNYSIKTNADIINSTAEQIAKLNIAIAEYERSGYTANDLRDQRNLLLDKLSRYVNITYENSDINKSMIDVKIGGVDLVAGVSFNKIEITSASSYKAEIDAITKQIADINAEILAGTLTSLDGKEQIDALITDLTKYIDVELTANPEYSDLYDVTFCGVALVYGSSNMGIEDAVEPNVVARSEYCRNNLTLDGVKLSIENGTVISGELYSHMEMVISDGSGNTYGEGIPYYIDKLNELARLVAQTINDIHTTGYTYPTNEQGSITGVDFFNVPLDISGNRDYSRITAGNFRLSDSIFESVWNIAGSSDEITQDNTFSGNSKIAEKLRDSFSDGKYYGALNSLVSTLAISLKTSKSVCDTKKSLLDSIETQRMSISGVSIDEEATNLIVYQQSYNACSRVINALDEMLDILIRDTGVVGR